MFKSSKYTVQFGIQFGTKCPFINRRNSSYGRIGSDSAVVQGWVSTGKIFSGNDSTMTVRRNAQNGHENYESIMNRDVTRGIMRMLIGNDYHSVG